MGVFSYARNAQRSEIWELVRSISPMETEGLPPEVRDTLCASLIRAAAECRTYSAYLDGRLAGICFVRDLADRREMCFAKTRYLTEERKIAFALGVPRLLRDLAEMESMARRDAKPMYMHVPEGDTRSKEWFVRAGCTETEGGLLCPGGGKES